MIIKICVFSEDPLWMAGCRFKEFIRHAAKFTECNLIHAETVLGLTEVYLEAQDDDTVATSWFYNFTHLHFKSISFHRSLDTLSQSERGILFKHYVSKPISGVGVALERQVKAIDVF